MIKFKTGTHYYDCRGAVATPQHDATLREARKQLLYPSVTTIDKEEFVNNFLQQWKLNELVIAASENFRMPHEEPEDYANRIYEISLEKSRTAAIFGNELHKVLEEYPQMPMDPKFHPWIEFYRTWYNDNVLTPLSNEKILFDHDIGVAGRTDFICALKSGGSAVVDYKTQNVKKDKKGRKVPAFYDSWARQLAFYAVCEAKATGTYPTSIPVCISLVIDSNEPSAPHVKQWTDKEIKSAYEDFVIAAYRYFKSRSFWPQPNGPFTVSPSVLMPI